MCCLYFQFLIQYSYPLPFPCYHTHSLVPLLREATLMWRALEPQLKQGYHLFPSYGSTTEESLCLKYLSRTWQRWFHLLVHELMVAYPELEWWSPQKMGSSSYQHLKYRCVIFWNTSVKYMSYIVFIEITGSMVRMNCDCRYYNRHPFDYTICSFHFKLSEIILCIFHPSQSGPPPTFWLTSKRFLSDSCSIQSNHGPKSL